MIIQYEAQQEPKAINDDTKNNDDDMFHDVFGLGKVDDLVLDKDLFETVELPDSGSCSGSDESGGGGNNKLKGTVITVDNINVTGFEDNFKKFHDDGIQVAIDREDLDSRLGDGDGNKAGGGSGGNGGGGEYRGYCYENMNGNISVLKVKFLLFCILVLEFCERLSYFAVLSSQHSLLTYVFLMGNGQSSAITASFVELYYCAPLIGGYIADRYYGRRKVILFCVLTYFISLVLFSVSTYPTLNYKWMYFFSLLCFVPIGSGGIKPNIVNFGADQFKLIKKYGEEKKRKWRKSFFLIFTW